LTTWIFDDDGDHSATHDHRAWRVLTMAAELIEMGRESEAKITPEYRTAMREGYGSTSSEAARAAIAEQLTALDGNSVSNTGD
jgi:hypothetical protein